MHHQQQPNGYINNDRKIKFKTRNCYFCANNATPKNWKYFYTYKSFWVWQLTIFSLQEDEVEKGDSSHQGTERAREGCTGSQSSKYRSWYGWTTRFSLTFSSPLHSVKFTNCHKMKYIWTVETDAMEYLGTIITAPQS